MSRARILADYVSSGDELAATTATADAALPKAGGAMTGAITTNSTFDGIDIATRDAVLTSTTTTAGAALPKAGGAMTGAITTNSTFDGIDIATRDAVLTSTTTTANAALPKAGGTMTGNIVMGDDTSIGIADDAERIEFDGAGDISVLGANLGIGETAPSGKLHVVNGSGITLPTLESSARNMGIFEGDNAENYIVTACPNDSTVGLLFADPDHKAAGAVVYAHGDNHMRFVTNTSEGMRIDTSGNVGIGVSPNISERLAVKCADSTTPNLRVLGAASGAATEGAVCMSPGDLEASAAGAFVVHYFTQGSVKEQLDFTVTVGGDDWRGGPCGSYLITMQGGNWQGGGFLSVNKPRSGTYLIDWEQVWSSGSSATISLTTSTLTAFTCTGYLVGASTDNFYYGYTILKVSGSGGNGGGPLTFSQS